ncbi:hypothetical protein INR49_008217 [Caranx melampygus]|nr:hypothetical protein INR49_008217 [Caranx melampygus]
MQTWEVLAAQGPDERVLVTSVCFHGDYPLYHHNKIKVTVYHAEDPASRKPAVTKKQEQEEEEEEEVMERAERCSAGVC